MGSAKEYMFELAHERMIRWMRDTYSIAEDVDLDEDYPGYEGMASVYEHEQEREDYESHMQWFDEHPYDEIYNSFRGRLRQLIEMIEKDRSPFTDKMIHQMVFAHSVTLFEAMVGDVIKAVVLKHSRMMEMLIKGMGEEVKNKFSLEEICKYSSINGIIMSVLNSVTFHDIKQVEKYVNMFTASKFASEYAGRMIQITILRHDFVHRNGKNKEGEYHLVTTGMVLETISVIEEFSEDIYQAIIGEMSPDEF